MKNNRELMIMAAVVSFLIHSLFFASSKYFVLPGMTELKKESRNLFRIQRVEKKTEPVRLLSKKEEKPRALKMSQKLSEGDNSTLKKMMLDEMVDQDLYFDKKKEDLKEELVGDKLLQGKKGLEDELFDDEAEMIKESAAPEKRSILKTFMGKTINTASGGGNTDQGEMDYNLQRKGFRWAVPTTGMMKMLKKGLSNDGGFFKKKAQIGSYEDISDVLGIEVRKYIDKKTGEKYFKIDIKVGDNANLSVIPKEVIFLIDSSKSITEDKLSYVKDAITNSIWDMNPGDRFNIVAFSGDLVKYHDRSVEAGTGTLLGAEMFIKNLRAVGQTDVDNALLGMVGSPPEKVPSYIVLVTDGRPTTGVIDSRRIIEQITLKNNMDRPIFSFGGGARVNRYLLDFISYQNRGWSRFADRTFQIEEEFKKLYAQIKDPLLLNVRYRLSNVPVKEVYPKYLPDLFKGRVMTIYGRFDDEDKFSMQLLGDMGKKTKELIFQESLNEAVEGDESIAEGWAFRKIYYLISQETKGKGDMSKIREEIKHLSKKYGIVTPYDIEEVD